MTVTTKKLLPWFAILVVIFTISLGFVAYDVRKSGGWRKSQSVRTLKEMGVWEYGEKTLIKAQQGLNWTRETIEEYAPGYVDYTLEYIEPYYELTRDLGLIIYNLGDSSITTFNEQYPYVIKFVENEAPGYVDALQKNVKGMVASGRKYIYQGYEYVTTQVFVGELAPENMQKVVMNALNTTQHYATEYYLWLYEKIETTVNGK